MLVPIVVVGFLALALMMSLARAEPEVARLRAHRRRTIRREIRRMRRDLY